MQEEVFNLTGEEARLLLEISLMAAGHNRFRSATEIIMALDAYRPENQSVDEAKAFLCIAQQAFNDALDFIEHTALPRHPESGMLQVFHGMALLNLNRMAEANASFEKAIASTDKCAAALAEKLLGK